MKKLRGFTLIESVIALFCLTLVVLLLASNLQLIKRANEFLPQSNDVAYAYVKLDNFLQKDGGFSIDTENSTSKKMVIQKSRQKEPGITVSYVVEFYQSMIRVRGNSSGHMPLIVKISSATFRICDDGFQISLRERNGQVSELYFKASLLEQTT